ncbi:unnamed protein product [Schistosoma rodhaini]|uniref:Uncharacterized protein n=1 Tax=Schistosoma rodhaini TaxID=6188 RepID=A0AA85F9L2_9TREM|nr:unnamed protein product [Schistosoma rodhaini]
MKLTHILLICFISFLFFTYVQCDGNYESEEEENEEEEKPSQPDVPHGKHPLLRKAFFVVNVISGF